MKYSKGILSLLVIAATGSSAASADNANNQTTNDDRRRLSPSDPIARILGQGNGKDNAPGQAKKRFKLAAKVAGSETGQLLEVDVKEVTNAITSATTMGSSKLPIGKDLDAIYVADNAGTDDDTVAIIGVNPRTEDMHGIVMPGKGKGKPMKISQKKGKDVSSTFVCYIWSTALNVYEYDCVCVVILCILSHIWCVHFLFLIPFHHT